MNLSGLHSPASAHYPRLCRSLAEGHSRSAGHNPAESSSAAAHTLAAHTLAAHMLAAHYLAGLKGQFVIS